ncbi:MAG: helix-turn-helix transcriptional regulator [Clostridia bacterium]|nr:helix-turn-helix transcriptional regulator [Clostridia bacterium]
MNAALEKAIGQNIRKIREEKKLTQDYVAAQLQLMGCDITRSALAKIEVGQRHLYPDEIILLRRIFQTDYDDIFFLEEDITK